MPGGEDLTKFLKKSPGTDARNLIEPSVDARYLAMKVRAGQTKDMFELLDTDDSKLLYLDELGRYLVYKPTTNRGEVYIIKEGDETLINDAMAEFVSPAWVTLFFPPGTWTCPNALNLNSNIVRFFGAGGDQTVLLYSPAAPTATTFINTDKNGTIIESISFSTNSNVTGYLISIDKQECQVCDCILTNGGSGNGISISQDYSKILRNQFTMDGDAVVYSGQQTRADLKENRFNGLSGGSSRGVYLDPSATARMMIEDNWFYSIDKAIEIANGKTLTDSKIEGNFSNAGTNHINHIGTPAGLYLVHGNIFTGAGAFVLPAATKQRDNIGLADAN